MLPSATACLWNFIFKTIFKESHIASPTEKQLLLSYYYYDPLDINISKPKQKEILVFLFEIQWSG